MNDLTLKGDAQTFEALKTFLQKEMPYTFRSVITNLGEALEQHRVDLEFEPIGRILRLEFNDDYNSKRQIYVDGVIDSHIGHFTDGFGGGHCTHIPNMVIEIIKKLNLSETDVHVCETFVMDAMDESEPVMAMVIHSGQYAGTLVRFNHHKNSWVRPDEFIFSLGGIPWKRYKEFNTVDEFICQINASINIE